MSAKLLYSKSRVYLHPSSAVRDNIPGFLAIVRVAGSDKVYLSWVPQTAIEGTPEYDSYVFVDGADGASDDIAVSFPEPAPLDNLQPEHAFCVPLKSLYSLVVQPPTLTSWFGSVTLNVYDTSDAWTKDTVAITATVASKTLPTLYFHDDETPQPARGWGGEGLLTELRRYVRVVRSRLEPKTFLINPSREDLVVHSSALFADDPSMSAITYAGGAGRAGSPAGKRGTSRAAGSTSAGSTGAASTPGSPGSPTPPTPNDILGLNSKARPSFLHQNSHSSLYAVPHDPLFEDAGLMDNVTFNVLNSFSKITRAARSATQTVLAHPLAAPILKNVPEPMAQLATVSGEMTRLQDAAGVGAYDAARVYLAKWAKIVADEGERARRAHSVSLNAGSVDSAVGAFELLASTYSITRPRPTRAYAQPIAASEWDAWFALDTGRLLLTPQEARKRIFQRGLSDAARRAAWPFLLGVFTWDSTEAERRATRAEKTREYERRKALWYDSEELRRGELWAEENHRIEIDCRRTDRTHPMFASTGESGPDDADEPHAPSNAHVYAMQEILTTYIFAYADIDPRCVAGEPDSVQQERYPFVIKEGEGRVVPEAKAKTEEDKTAEEAEKGADIAETKDSKDTRTAAPTSTASDPPSSPTPTHTTTPSETYTIPTRNYVQGMSDLLSPIYVVCEGDAPIVYWAFETLMKRMECNFMRDQSGMKRQLSQLQSLIALMDSRLYKHLEETGSLNLFFCFRWILCCFKRELVFADTLALWEVLWTDHLGPNLHLFVALAILEQHRDVIIRYLREFDEILKYVNELSQTLDIQSILSDAEVLYRTFEKVVEAADAHNATLANASSTLRQRRPPVEDVDGSYIYVPDATPPPGSGSVQVEAGTGSEPWEIDPQLRCLLRHQPSV